MTTVQELVSLGEKMGLKGEELRSFVKEQQQTEREERQKERQFDVDKREKEQQQREKEQEQREKEREEREKERQFEIEKLKLTMLPNRSDVSATSESGENDEIHGGDGESTSRRGPKVRGPKMPPFDERDDMDSYLHRFERYAELQEWDHRDWAIYLSALLKGKALDVYARLPVHQAQDYETLKQALLKRYSLTEEGYKQRFYESKPEKGESPQQFITRLDSYFLRWLDLAKVESTFEGVRNLIVKERFLATCHKSLELFLRERATEDLQELAKLAEQFEDAHGPPRATYKKDSSSGPTPASRNEGEGKGTKVLQSSGAGGRPKPKCYVCGKVGHIAKNCFQRQQTSAMVQTGSRGSGRNFNSNQPQGQKPNMSAECGSQNSVSEETVVKQPVRRVYCKTHNREYCTECCNIESGHVCNAMLGTDVELKCGCTAPVLAEACDLVKQIKAKMPVSDGRMYGKPVRVLRDTGCSTVVVKKSLVSKNQLTGRNIVCLMIDGTARRNPTALVEIESPYLTGTVEAVCMERPLYDVIIGNVPGVTGPIMDQDAVNNGIQDDGAETQAVITRSQAKKEEKVRLLNVASQIDGNLSTQELIELQRGDESLSKWWKEAQEVSIHTTNENYPRFEVKNGLLFRKTEAQRRTVNQLAVPTSLRSRVMKLAHESIMSGHQATKKTHERVVAHFFWPGVHGDVKRFCQSCDICQRTVPKGRVVKTPLGKMPLIDSPFKRVAVDLVGPIAPVTDRGNRYILTMVDYATRYPEATALKSIEAETVAEALVTMFTRVGIPEEILSDQGSQFLSGVMKEVSRLLSMNQLVTTPYHPMCNGLVERFNGHLKSMLRKMCAERPKDWDRYLPALLFAYREVPQESLGFSPFELLYGRTVRGPMSILKEIWTKEKADPEVKLTYQYVLELQDRLQDTCEVARQELQRSQGKQKRYYDVKSRERKFQAGDKVLLLLPTDGNKLLMQWKGPFEILECRNDNNYRIQLEGRVKMFHANMLKKYMERKQDDDVQVGGAVVFEETQDLETGEIVEFVGDQKENYLQVNINPQLSQEQKDEVEKVLSEFQDVFTDVPKVTILGEHSIELTSLEPIRSRAYPLPFAMREAVDQELDSMLASGVIEPSTAPYASPIVVVKKSDGSNRICIDFRKLNKITVFDPEPMPQMREIFAELSGTQYYSKFDFSKGYWQIPMREEDKDLTTFVTHRGLFRFRVMPFGLVNAPATFSRIMRKVLDGLLHLHNYLDDVLEHTRDWSGHVISLRQFLGRVRAANLALKPSKCFVGFTSLVFLGHEVAQGELSPSTNLVNKIQQAVAPTTKKQLRSFLGLVGYYRMFVPNFAAIAVPLTDLTRKGAPNTLVWTHIHEQAFHTLKEAVCNPPVLRLPDVGKPFILQTDASSEGIGAILLQEVDQVKHPVAFASRKLLPREKNYSTIEREALAIVWGVQKFEHYLLGTHFSLETDHHPLQYLHQAKFQSGRLMRWSLILQPYRFTVRAIKGSENVGADFLSRYVD